jgi:DNA-binding NarL/FixJ family response regulator
VISKITLLSPKYLSSKSLFGQGVEKSALLTFVQNNPNPKSADAHSHHLKTSFSERQIIILSLLTQGGTKYTIAKYLNYSVSTVRHEVMSIFRALKISSRHESGPVAANAGLI